MAATMADNCSFEAPEFSAQSEQSCTANTVDNALRQRPDGVTQRALVSKMSLNKSSSMGRLHSEVEAAMMKLDEPGQLTSMDLNPMDLEPL
jgi:hypothetical protein